MSISEQVKQIRRYVKDYRHPFHNQGVEIYGTDKALEQAADTIESISANLEEPKWIPCSAHLPKDKKTVLICGDTGWIKTGWYESGCWWTGFSLANIEDGVMAWQPLPEPYRP